MINSKKCGFTLVELAVVLTIIGFLVGAIFVGNELITASKLRSVMTEIQRYNAAITEYKNKYNYLPGDDPNATRAWGADASCPSTPYTTTPHQATCDGNGDGYIGDYGVFSVNMKENYRAWQHLSNAGLIPGSYSGTSQGNNDTAVLGVNVPASEKFPIAGYYVLTYTVDPSTYNNTLYFPGNYNNSYWFGMPRNGENTVVPVISGKSALAIDSKFDDGMPASGKIMTFKGSNGYVASDCATTNDASTAQYSSADAVVCSLIFVRQF